MRFLVPELVSNTNGCFSKFTSFVEIDSDLDAYSRIQSLDNRRGEQMMAGKKFDTGGLAAKRGQAIKVFCGKVLAGDDGAGREVGILVSHGSASSYPPGGRSA